MKKRSMDLTQGSILRLLVIFALPIFASQLLQTLYNSVDSIVVGNLVGKTALAAVSSTADVTMILVGFFNGLSAGAGVLFARHFGAKDSRLLHDSIHTSLCFAMILGVAMTAAGILLTPWLLRFMNCPEDVFTEAVQYLRIYFVGVLFSSLYNVGAGVLRAVGDSRSPFIYLVIGTVLNTVLDVVFVGVLKWGVVGVGVATVVAQLVTCVLVFGNMLLTNDVHKLVISDLRIHKELLKEVIRLALPSGMQMSIVSISNVIILSNINAFGSSVMAAMGTAKKVDRFVEIIGNSLGLATATFVSQNLGAGKPERAFRSIRVALALTFSLLLLLGSALYISAGVVPRIFTDDPETISYCTMIMRIILVFIPVQALYQVMSNAGRGFGKSGTVMILAILGLTGLRQIYVSIVAHYTTSLPLTILGFPVGWICAASLVSGYFLIFIYRKYRREKALT